MRKFKHKMTGTLGTVEEDGFLHFVRESGEMCAHESISMELIEGSSDWEEIEEVKEDILPTKFFQSHEISTWIGEPLGNEKPIEELQGGHGKLIVLHQCGNNKNELLSQIKTLVNGIITDFEDFAG